MEWKRIFIKGNETRYSVSETGTVYNHDKGKFMKPYMNKGYLLVPIRYKKYKKNYLIHRLVAEAFIPKPDGKDYVNHIDGNKENNNVSNLEWCTASENSIHAFNMGLRTNPVGEDSHLNKFKESTIVWICDQLMLNRSPVDIASIVGMSDKMVYMLRDGKAWKHVTSKYKFPKQKQNHSKLYPLEFRQKITSLIMQGKTNKEIYAEMGIVTNKSIQDLIYRIKKSCESEGSTTIEPRIVIRFE